jgi:glycosyltransferase involved in cell wall biosynthesis
MPVHNTKRYVGQAIESVLAQTFTDFELLIIDDGSTDGSLEVIRSYALKDRRIRVISRENRGIVATRNEALAAIESPFMAMMDSDDVSTPDRLEQQLAVLTGAPSIQLVTSRLLLIDPEGAPLCFANALPDSHSFRATLLSAEPGFLVCNAYLLRTQRLKDIGGFRADYPLAEDLDMFVRIASEDEIVCLPEVLYWYRQHPGSVCHRQGAMLRDCLDRLRSEHGPRHAVEDRPSTEPATPPPTQVGETDRSIHEKWAWWALGAGFVPTARKHAVRALLKHPLSWGAWRLTVCAARGH